MKDIIIAVFLVFNFLTSAAQLKSVPVYASGTEGYTIFRIPAIVCLPDGTLLAFCEGRVNGAGDFGNIDIVMKFSKDKGRRWSALSVVAENGELQLSNPAPVIDLTDPLYPKGRLFLFYNSGNKSEGEIIKGNGIKHCFYKTSVDNGASWSDAVDITTQVHRPNQPSVDARYTFDDDWRYYANTPGHAMQFQNGKFKGRIFIAANHSSGEPQKGGGHYVAHGYYTDDHGKTFKLGNSLNLPGSNESMAAELSGSRLIMNSRNQKGDVRARIVSLSSDGGESWDTTYFDQSLPDPVCQGSILNIGVKNGKQILAFCNAADTKNRNNLTLRISFDEGRNWTKSFPVYKNQSEIKSGFAYSAYSDLVKLSKNTIGIIFEKDNYSEIAFTTLRWEFSFLNETQSESDITTGRWGRFEKTFKNDHPYKSPFADVELLAEFTSPDGRKIKTWGFYDDSNTWRLRFMPDQSGKWNYVAWFTDLPGQKISGVLQCTPSDIPGLISADETNPVWFGFKGGKHIFIRSFHVGDRFFASNWPDEKRKEFLDWAIKNKYNTLSIASHYLNRDGADRGRGWKTPALWNSEKQQPDPHEYAEIESMQDDLAKRKLILFPFGGFFGQNSNYPRESKNQLIYLKYTMARLGSYWNLLFNVSGPEPLLPKLNEFSMEQINSWGKTIASLNTSNHLLTVHNPTNLNPFINATWASYQCLQGPKTVDPHDLYSGLMARRNPKQPDNGFCLAVPGDTYLVYLPYGGNVTVNLLPEHYQGEWIKGTDTKIRQSTNGKTFQTPSADGWLLYLTKN